MEREVLLLLTKRVDRARRKAKLNAITILLVNREKPQREGSEKGPNCEEKIEYGGWNMNGLVHSPVSSPRTHSKTCDTAGEKRPMKSLEVSGMKIPIKPDRVLAKDSNHGPEQRSRETVAGNQRRRTKKTRTFACGCHQHQLQYMHL